MPERLTPEQLNNDLLKTAQDDPNVIGFFLTGSRGKGMVTEHSDYDATMVVKNETADEYKQKYKGYGGTAFDLSVKTTAELQADAVWGSPTAWDRYNYAHLKAQIDKSGEVQKLIDEKGTLPADKREEFVAGLLDQYINQVYRSIKCSRDGKSEASLLEAAESITPLVSAYFALEGRLKPYYKYLDWELTKFPLVKLPWPKDEFIQKLTRILKTGDIKLQQEMLKTTEQVFRKDGFNALFDSWEENLPWMESF
jgi:hypothetical protein